MKLDEFTRERMSVFFNHLASNSMVDSPDGPNATKMRELGARTELDEADIKLVHSKAIGQIGLYGQLLQPEYRRPKVMLTHLAVLSDDPSAALREVKQMFSPHPEQAATEAAADLLWLIGSAPELQPRKNSLS